MTKDILIRAGKTFVQAFVGAITIDSLAGVTDTDALKKVLIGMGIAGISAGVSAVWNMLVQFIKEA